MMRMHDFIATEITRKSLTEIPQAFVYEKKYFLVNFVHEQYIN